MSGVQICGIQTTYVSSFLHFFYISISYEIDFPFWLLYIVALFMSIKLMNAIKFIIDDEKCSVHSKMNMFILFQKATNTKYSFG